MSPGPRKYLIWSLEHCAWWRPGRAGYTLELAGAGRYSEEEAREILERANYPPPRVNECLIPEAAVTRRPPTIGEELERLETLRAALRGAGFVIEAPGAKDLPD